MTHVGEKAEQADARLDLARHPALKTRPGGDVLVLPERAIRVGGTGGEILRIVQGGRRRAEIVEEMRRRYPGTPEIDAQVEAFLAEMLELGGIARVDASAAEVGS